MYRLPTVFMLLVAVTFLLSLVLVLSICPVAVDVVCIDSMSDLPHALSVCVGNVLSIIPRTLTTSRLTRVCGPLALAIGNCLRLIIVKTLECLRRLFILSCTIGCFLIWVLFESAAEAVSERALLYLPALCSIISVCCLYVLLCGAPVLVFYCVVLDAKPDLEPKQEPGLDIPYAVVRRRKLPRMLRERYEREREQALRREAERQQARLAASLLPRAASFETETFEPPATESDPNHPTKQRDTEAAGLAPLPSTHAPEGEACNVIIPPSPPSSMHSPQITTTCSESTVSSASTNSSTLAADCVPTDPPATSDTEYHENSCQAEDTGFSLSEDVGKESKLNASSIAGENDTPGLDVPLPAPLCTGNIDTPLAVEHEVIAKNDSPTTISRPISSSLTTGSPVTDVFRSGTENSAENLVDLDASDAIVQDILATPEMAALIEAAVAELGSALENDIVNPSPSETNQISTNEDVTRVGSTASTTGSHTPQDDSNLNACSFENDGAGRSDTTITACPAQGAPAPSAMDVHMTMEQVDAVLELLDAELARTDGDLAGLDLDPGLGASESTDMRLLPPPISSVSAPTDADLQALDVMWESMGINPAEPVNLDIDLGAMMGVDSNVSTTETRDGVGIDAQRKVYAPGEPVAVPPADTSLNVAGPAMDCGVEMSDEECLAVLAQMCEEGIGAMLGDMDLDEMKMAPIATADEQEAMAQQPDSSTPSTAFGAPDCTEWDVSMSGEECIAQLAELCKGIAPATNPELDLEQTLTMLSGGNSMEGRVSQDMTGSKYDLILPPKKSNPTSAGPSECMRLEDVIDFAMVDMSESEDGSEYLATPIIGQMEMGETLTKAG
ncbi:hypothetical protein FRC08_007255 [Ceratobasidium sp. 394]|nr:hypothetical protein FRC08_007255 [Ceratobasidium sp. 394]